MPIALTQEKDDAIFRMDIRGLLTRAEAAQCEADLARALAKVGSLKLLCVLSAFEGWEPGSSWGDLTFYVRHGHAIERIAIVGDERWRAEALMFAAADLRKAPVEFFPSNDLPRARAWLSGVRS